MFTNKTNHQLEYITQNMRMYPRNYALGAKREIARRHKARKVREDVDKWQFNDKF